MFKYILLFLLSLSTLNANAQSIPGIVGTVTLGGSTLTLSSEIILHTQAFSNTVSSFYRVDGATRGVYQVTTGKTFYIDAVCFDQGTTGGSASGNWLLYADNSAGGVNQSTSMTNAVGMLSGVATGSVADAYSTTASPGYHCVQFAGTAPALKYPYVNKQASNEVITVYGHEI